MSPTLATLCSGIMAPDAPRYRALGNSMAVPCVRWILERIGRAMATEVAA